MALKKLNQDIEIAAFIRPAKGLVVHGMLRAIRATKERANRKAGHMAIVELMAPSVGCFAEKEYDDDSPGEKLKTGTLVGVRVAWFARDMLTIADGTEVRITYGRQVKLDNGNKVWKGDFEADENAARRVVTETKLAEPPGEPGDGEEIPF